MKGLILWSDSYFGDTVIEIRIVDCKSDIYGYYLQQNFSNLAIWSHKTRKAIEILFRRGFPGKHLILQLVNKNVKKCQHISHLKFP